MKLRAIGLAIGIATVVAGPWPAAFAQEATVYRCPGKPGPDGRRTDEYTNIPSPQQAKDQGCRTIEGAPITVIQTSRPRAPATPATGGVGNAGARPDEGTRVPAADQRARDSERRSILEGELKASQDKLDALRREYNNGEPERRGDERNYAKYQERVAELKAGIERHESDIASIKREISKLP